MSTDHRPALQLHGNDFKSGGKGSTPSPPHRSGRQDNPPSASTAGSKTSSQTGDKAVNPFRAALALDEEEEDPEVVMEERKHRKNLKERERRMQVRSRWKDFSSSCLYSSLRLFVCSLTISLEHLGFFPSLRLR